MRLLENLLAKRKEALGQHPIFAELTTLDDSRLPNGHYSPL
jgi:hypothetical protein